MLRRAPTRRRRAGRSAPAGGWIANEPWRSSHRPDGPGVTRSCGPGPAAIRVIGGCGPLATSRLRCPRREALSNESLGAASAARRPDPSIKSRRRARHARPCPNLPRSTRCPRAGRRGRGGSAPAPPTPCTAKTSRLSSILKRCFTSSTAVKQRRRGGEFAGRNKQRTLERVDGGSRPDAQARYPLRRCEVRRRLPTCAWSGGYPAAVVGWARPRAPAPEQLSLF